MKSVLYLLSVVVVVAGLLSSSAQALTPFGVPAATLEKGQFATGFGYSHSNMDIVVPVLWFDIVVPDNKVDTYLANLVFGAHENWELQFDIGLSKAKREDEGSSSDFTGGFGIRNTLYKQDKFAFGSVFAIHFYEASSSGYDFGVDWKETDKWIEIQVALGPSFTSNRWTLYGGPFLHWIDGEADYDENGFSMTEDFEQDNIFGGFVGAKINVAKNTDIGFEYQNTGSAYALSFNILFRF